jgi:hypothetical protein
MSKAYPGMQNTEIYTSLSIEHMLNGINDQSIAYDVLTKRPQTLQEAVSLLSWHSSCKNGIGAKQHIRQVHAEEEEPCTPEIKRVENKQFVTEDRLDTFGRELTRSITSTMREIQKDIQNYVDQKVGHTLAKSSFVCYGCGEEGHTRKTCPLSHDKKNARADLKVNQNQERSNSWHVQKTEKKSLN